MNRKIIIISILLIILITLIAKKIMNNNNYEMAPVNSNILGDVNGDGKVNSSDYILIRKHIMGKSIIDSNQKQRADVNIDGMITSSDYVIVRKAILYGTTIDSPKIKVTGVSLDKNTLSLIVGESKQLTATISPSNATNKEVIWTSSDSNIASVDNGKVTGKSAGNVTITVKTSDGEKTASCVVTVVNKEVKKYTITFDANGGSVKPTNIQVEEGKSYGTLPTPIRESYKFIGWSTSKNEGSQINVTANTIATSNTTIYAIWEVINIPTPTPNTYVITEDSKYSSYAVIKEYSSSTLKYRIIVDNEKDNYVLVWASNPINQMNSALATTDALHSASAETILDKEITTYGYQNKGMVAVNASFYSPTNNANGTPWDGVVISHGRAAKDTGVSAGVIGINSSGVLKQYYKDTASNILADGVKNTFVISSLASIDNTTARANRTQICQYDKNNFVIFSGSGTVKYPAEKIATITGCTETYNLDGGGSRKLYYKDSSTSKMTKKYGGDRIIPDMLYFVEQ